MLWDGASMTGSKRFPPILGAALLLVTAAIGAEAQGLAPQQSDTPEVSAPNRPEAKPLSPAVTLSPTKDGTTDRNACAMPDREHALSRGSASDAWSGRDYAALFSGVAGVLAFFAAIWSTSLAQRANRANLVSKNNEAEVSAIEGKLDGFFGPYLRLSETNRLLHEDLRSRQADPANFRTLIHLLNPDWRSATSATDKTIIDEIMHIDGQLELLIRKNAGKLDIQIQPYLARASAHFRIIRLAHKGKLDQDTQRFGKYVYPRTLDQVLQLEVDRLEARRQVLRQNPGKIPKPIERLAIPQPLQLAPWV